MENFGMLEAFHPSALSLTRRSPVFFCSQIQLRIKEAVVPRKVKPALPIILPQSALDLLFLTMTRTLTRLQQEGRGKLRYADKFYPCLITDYVLLPTVKFNLKPWPIHLHHACA
jgi:hypothetical protein